MWLIESFAIFSENWLALTSKFRSVVKPDVRVIEIEAVIPVYQAAEIDWTGGPGLRRAGRVRAGVGAGAGVWAQSARRDSNVSDKHFHGCPLVESVRADVAESTVGYATGLIPR